mgnify:CR=1 FL=1
MFIKSRILTVLDCIPVALADIETCLLYTSDAADD